MMEQRVSLRITQFPSQEHFKLDIIRNIGVIYDIY